MKKKIFLMMLFVNCTSTLLADLAPRDSFMITQPDGTTLWLHERGDEFYHWEESTDGFVLVQNAQGVMEYARIENNQLVASRVKVHNVQEKSQGERAFANSQKQIVCSEINATARKTRKRLAPRRVSIPTSPVIGIRKILTVLVGFSDLPFTYTANSFDSLMNMVGYSSNLSAGSVRDYYYENSYGQLTIQATVIGPFVANSLSAYYSRPQGGGNGVDYHTPELVREAIEYAKTQQIDLSSFDGDNDGNVDCIHIVFAGNRYHVGNSGIIWPYHSHYDTTFTQNGHSISISNYIMTPEKLHYTHSNITTIGTICHELGHVLGAPDFYGVGVSETDKDYVGTGIWDVMAEGDQALLMGAYPTHHNPYTKTAIFQWTSPVTISSSENNTIYSIPSSSMNSNAIYKIPTSTEGEYYLLENRQKESFNSYLLDSGLLIYHIHSDIRNAVEANHVNSYFPQKCYLANPRSEKVLPNDLDSYGTTETNIFPANYLDGPANIFFTSQTTPSSVSWDSVPTGVDICFIQHDGNNMKFVVNPQIEGPTYLCDSAYYYVRSIPDSATIHWTGGIGRPYFCDISGSAYSDSVLYECGYHVIDTMLYNSGNIINGHHNPFEPIIPAIEDTSMTLRAVVSYAGKSYTLQKIVYASGLGTPNVQVSDSVFLWERLSSRTFTIMNCTEVPDSLLIWSVYRTNITPHQLLHLSTGRSMTYTPTMDGIYEVTAINNNKQCGTNSSTKRYAVVTPIKIKATVSDGVLNVNLTNDEKKVKRIESIIVKDNGYTIDLWHPIYGLMNSYKLRSATEQIDTKGLPMGVYIIVLKENGTIIANTKVLIK